MVFVLFIIENSTRINNKRKIYKLNMTHIKRINEMLSSDSTCIHREPNENWEQFEMKMKKIYEKAVDMLEFGMSIDDVKKIMKDCNIKLASYSNEINGMMHFYTADGNRDSEGIFVTFDDNDGVVMVAPPYRDKKFTY